MSAAFCMTCQTDCKPPLFLCACNEAREKLDDRLAGPSAERARVLDKQLQAREDQRTRFAKLKASEEQHAREFAEKQRAAVKRALDGPPDEAACHCRGPRPGEPVCPCMMRDVRVINGRYVRITDLGPAPMFSGLAGVRGLGAARTPEKPKNDWRD